MARKERRTAPAQPAPVPEKKEQPKGRTVCLSPVVLALIIVLSFVCGLLAGSMISVNSNGQQAQVQSAPAPAQAPAAQQQKSAPAPAMSDAERMRIRELESALLQKPDNRDALVELGNLYFDTGQHASSVQAYEAALALNANDANVLTDCGVMYRALGQYDKALEKFRKAQEVQPGHAIAMFNEGIVLNFDLHQHAEGVAVWRELQRLHPDATAPDGRTVGDLIRQFEGEIR